MTRLFEGANLMQLELLHRLLVIEYATCIKHNPLGERAKTAEEMLERVREEIALCRRASAPTDAPDSAPSKAKRRATKTSRRST